MDNLIIGDIELSLLDQKPEFPIELSQDEIFELSYSESDKKYEFKINLTFTFSNVINNTSSKIDAKIKTEFTQVESLEPNDLYKPYFHAYLKARKLIAFRFQNSDLFINEEEFHPVNQISLTEHKFKKVVKNIKIKDY